MKKSVFSYSFSVIILFILVTSISALTYPILNSAHNILQEKYDSWIMLLEENTGLTVTYKSLSPSILSGIRIKNIVITDTENKQSVLTINSIKLRWNILKLVSKNPEQAISGIIIDGTTIDYEINTQNTIIPKILNSFSTDSITPPSVVTEDTDILDSISTILQPIFAFPFNIQLKNTIIHYSNTSFITNLHLKSIAITNKTQKETYLNTKIDGKVDFELMNSTIPIGKISTNIALTGHITPDLKNSFSQIELSSLKNADFNIPALNLYATIENKIVSIVALQNILPFSLNINANTESSIAKATIITDNLDPLSLISPRNKNEMLQKIKGSTLSGSYELIYNWNSRKLNYTANGDVQLSKNVLGQNYGIFFDVNGDNKKISVDTFRVQSDFINAHYEGVVQIPSIAIAGLLTVDSVRLPSGNFLSTELYLDTINSKVSVFAPQIRIGEKSLTALQIFATQTGKSIDFNFEVSDYSRMSDGNPGLISANGSLDLEDKAFLQVEVLSEELFLASVNEILILSLPQEDSLALSNIKNFIEPYIFSLNAFITTDFKSISYSLPYAILANTQKDNELLMISANGNESVIEIPTFNLLYANQTVNAEFNMALGNSNTETFFNSSLFFNSIPYSFSGVISPQEFITITGDYGFTTEINFLENNGIDISTKAQDFPIALNKTIMSLDIDTSFLLTSPTEWFVDIFNLSIETKESNMNIKPNVMLSGNIYPTEIQIRNLIYTDKTSTVEGNLTGYWKIDNSILKETSLTMILEDSFSNEEYHINASLQNPENLSFSNKDFMNKTSLESNIAINNAPFSRFANFQTEKNTINANVHASGSIVNPTITVDIKDSNIMLNNNNLNFYGQALLKDHIITITDINIFQGLTEFKNISGNFSLTDFSGSLNGLLAAKLANNQYYIKKTISSPFSFNIETLSNNKNLPLKEKSFKANLIFEKLESTFFDTKYNYTVAVDRTPGRFDLTIGENSEVQGYLLDNGEISIIAKEGFFIEFDSYGILTDSELTMFFENIYTDASYFCNLVDLPVFSLHKGKINGNGTLTGPLNDLQINAILEGENIEVSIPDYVGEQLICSKMPITITENIISTRDAYFIAQETLTGVGLNLDCSLEELTFQYLDLNVKTLHEDLIKAQCTYPFGSFQGFGETDLRVYLEKQLVEITGTIDTQEVEAIISLGLNTDGAIQFDMNNNYGVETVIDLEISVGRKSKMYLPSKSNPIIRGLVSQIEPLRIQMDTRYGTSSITGELEMKGGEILYLNRTFFARTAKVVMNETIEEFNPRLTARAEIRERDQLGNPVQIFLTVEDQPLLEINPKFESIPSMSEQEIMTLLGEIIIGINADTSPLSLLGGIADYGTQQLLFRNIENAIRDTLHLDLFSIRTSFLENSLLYALDESETKNFSYASIFDNTSLYVGKYINDILYADAMLQLVYYENKQDNRLKGLVFRPEFGVELPSPFATIRWSIAPEITDDLKLLVPYTSISFKWRFNY